MLDARGTCYLSEPAKKEGIRIVVMRTRTTPVEQLGFDNAEFFPVQPRIEGAHYAVSDAPGLGVEVNEDLIKKQSFKFWEAPHPKRPDGSVTNW